MIVKILPRAKCTVVSSSDSAKKPTNHKTRKRTTTMAISTFVTLEMCGAYRAAFERDGFTEGLPAATTTCIALQKNRVEIRKDSL